MTVILRSLDRNDLVFMENQTLKRQNQDIPYLKLFWLTFMVLEKSRLIQQIHNLTIGEGLLDKNKSRMSFRANSLEQQYKLGVEESINGSTRDLFYDCEEELYMSGNDSSEEEHSGLYRYKLYHITYRVVLRSTSLHILAPIFNHRFQILMKKQLTLIVISKRKLSRKHQSNQMILLVQPGIIEERFYQFL